MAGTDLQHRISACVFPLGQVRCARRVSQEFYLTRRHGATPERRLTQSTRHTMNPATKREIRAADTYVSYPLGHECHETEAAGGGSRNKQGQTVFRTPIVPPSCLPRSTRSINTLFYSLCVPVVRPLEVGPRFGQAMQVLFQTWIKIQPTTPCVPDYSRGCHCSRRKCDSTVR